MNKYLSRLFIFILLIGLFSRAYSQLNAPGRDWATITQYLNNPTIQDSIFVFYSTLQQPQKGLLKARFSDGSLSDFKWYKYNATIINPANRFELIGTENGVVESSIINLDRGGYRVEITNASSVTEVYTAWLFIDDVQISSISVSNHCDYLRLDAVTNPDRFTIVYETFTYWDISRTNHPENNRYGRDYFKNVVWKADESRIPVPSTTNLYMIIQDPAPLYNATYNIQNTNPFGRSLSLSTGIITALAVKADFSINIKDLELWKEYDGVDLKEAPLELQFLDKSINADLLIWNIINDDTLFLKGGDSILWSQSTIYYEGLTVEPEIRLNPGNFPVEQIAKNTISGCMDTLKILVDVEKSLIDEKAIPNVFTPNGDGDNDEFNFIEREKNIKSIKYINIYIMNRWGVQVYDYHGDPKKWEGWDGYIDGHKGKAPDGVYYFIIEAMGWDNKRFKGGKYKGFFHLFRGE